MIVTEPYFNFTSIREGLSEILFEEYQFNSVLRTHPADLSVYNAVSSGITDTNAALVVDTGYRCGQQRYICLAFLASN